LGTRCKEGAVLNSLPLFKHEKSRGDEQNKANDIIPSQFLLEINDRKDAEHNERDNFLYRLELGAGKLVGSDPVRRHLKAIFKKCDKPADKNDLPQGYFPEFQMSVPGERHEDIRDRQQSDSFHTPPR